MIIFDNKMTLFQIYNLLCSSHSHPPLLKELEGSKQPRAYNVYIYMYKRRETVCKTSNFQVKQIILERREQSPPYIYIYPYSSVNEACKEKLVSSAKMGKRR